MSAYNTECQFRGLKGTIYLHFCAGFHAAYGAREALHTVNPIGMPSFAMKLHLSH